MFLVLRQVVQRFSMHHCSLFPLRASARSTFIFTSHVDQPLAVWDRSVQRGLELMLGGALGGSGGLGLIRLVA